MSKINDRWSALSMKDRAALIDIYVKSGITDLGEIRKDYNSFDYGGYTESPVDMGELEASFINPKQSRVNRRREVRRAFKSIKNLIRSDEIDAQDILNAYNGLNENQRKRALEAAMKFSPLAQPDGVLNVVKHHVLRKPRQAFKTLRYIMTGKGKPSLFAIGYDKGYNGLWHDSEGFSNGIIDALIYGNTIDPRIGTQTNKEDFGPELDYIRKNYKNKDIQYIQTNPGVTINQQNITPTSYVGSSGSFNTSMPGVSINNQGFILEKGTRNDSTFVRGLDVYDFKADDYSKKWDTENMYPVIQQIDTDTNPVAIKTPWVPEEEINTILSDSEGYSPYRKFGGKLNKFETGGYTEPLYYDDTYIEPAVVKAFKSQEEYNRYQGKKGAKAVRRGMNKAVNTISEGLRYTPVVGDVMDGLEAYEEAKTGNLAKAGVLAGLTLLPNALEKPIKAVSKPLKRYLTHGIDNDLFTLSMKKWKGSPMPSMSVNDLDIPIFDYGDMTFIGSEDLLDNSIIFRGDGLTPTISTVGGNEMMDPQEVIKRMKEQQKRKGEYNIGQIISKEEASTLPMRGGTEDYFEAKYQDFIPWNKFKHLVTKGELHPDLIKLIEDVGIPHTNVPEENYLEAIRKIAEEMNLVFNKGGKLNKFVTGGPTKNNWEIPFSLESTTVPITNYDYYTFVPEAVQIPISALKEKYAMAPELIARNDEEQLRELKERASKEYSYGIKSKILDNIGKQEEVNKSMLRSGYHNNQPDNYGYTAESEVDTSKRIKITAPNTNISKFIYGNTITEEALKEIKRVAFTRNLDPYDILAHMLIESSGNFGGITSNTYFNTHDVLERQINPKLLDTNNSRNIETLLKNLGVYDPAKQYTNEQIKDYILKYIKQLKEANANIEYPTSTIDAVGLRMSKFGRDFNPAQKGFKSDLGEIKHSYLEMIDSAIASLKENMPDLFK